MSLFNIPSSTDFTPSTESANLFIDLDSETATRAAYFRETALAGFEHLYNVYEPYYQMIEPPHPYRAADVPGVIEKLGYGQLSSQLNTAGLNLLMPALYNSYDSTGNLAQMIQQLELADQNYLFDPYYGIIQKLQSGRVQELPLISHQWLQYLRRLAPSVRDDRLAHPQDAFGQGINLAGGIFAPALEPGAYASAEVPCVTVESEAQYLQLVEELQRLAQQSNTGVELWFRGQNTDYLIPDRQALVARGIAKYSSVRDSSQVPNLYRHLDRFLSTIGDYERLLTALAEWFSCADTVFGPPFSIRGAGLNVEPPANLWGDYWESRHTVFGAKGNIITSYVKDFHLDTQRLQRGLLLQHYGCPTPWLDITKSPSIALWFALNKCAQSGGEQRYSETERKSDRDSWPTVFVFPLIRGIHPFLDTGSILRNTHALRPIRQQCGLLGGAGSMVRNYPARYVALKIRCAPGSVATESMTAAHLFPGPEEDGVLGDLIKREKTVWNSPPFNVTRLAR